MPIQPLLPATLLDIVSFVSLNTPFDTPVHLLVLLLRLSVCSSCSAIVNSRHLYFPLMISSIFFSVSVGIHHLWLGFVGPSTSWHVNVTTPFTLRHLMSMVSSSISSCGAWNLLERVMLNSFRFWVSFKRKVLYRRRWFVPSIQFLLSLSFNRAILR